MLPLINVLLGVLGYVRLLRLIETLTPFQKEAPLNADTLQTAKAQARMVVIAATYGFYRATCLRKSLLVLYLLRQRGIPGQLHFGARIVNAQLEAHAWVEWQDEVINDAADVRQRYAPLEGGIPKIQVGL